MISREYGALTGLPPVDPADSEEISRAPSKRSERLKLASFAVESCPVEIELYRCRACGSYDLGGWEEVVHLRASCRNNAELTIDRVLLVAVDAQAVSDPRCAWSDGTSRRQGAPTPAARAVGQPVGSTARRLRQRLPRLP